MNEATAAASREEIGDAETGAATPTMTERIRERPLLSLGLAGLAGFVLGGGTSSRSGAAMIMLVARIWLRRAATSALTSAITSHGTAKRNGSG